MYVCCLWWMRHIVTHYWYFVLFHLSHMILRCVIICKFYHTLTFWDKLRNLWQMLAARRRHWKGLAWLESCSALTSANVVERKRCLQLHPTLISLVQMLGVLGSICSLLCNPPVLSTFERYSQFSKVYRPPSAATHRKKNVVFQIIRCDHLHIACV